MRKVVEMAMRSTGAPLKAFFSSYVQYFNLCTDPFKQSTLALFSYLCLDYVKTKTLSCTIKYLYFI